MERRHNRNGSSGSSMCSQPPPVPGKRENCGPEGLPYMARLLQQQSADVIWINQNGKTKQRQVVGQRVVIRQQAAGPPTSPQVLVLADQMLECTQRPDKYLHVLAMVNYSLTDYARDIEDELIDLNYPHIIIFLGTMQLGIFEAVKVQQEVKKLMMVINSASPNSLVMFTGLLPRPMDHLRSRSVCESYNKMMKLTIEELKNQKVWNVSFLDVYCRAIKQ